MKEQQYKFIFDMDGTLYSFADGNNNSFDQSALAEQTRLNAFRFISEKLNILEEEAENLYHNLSEKYKGQTSIGLEKEYKIDRYEYFANTWTMEPEMLIKKNSKLVRDLADFKSKSVLLTGAPFVWARKVLAHLDVEQIFEGNIFTGEPDLRKPDPAIFQKASERLGVKPQQVISIGDQLDTDIIPAKQIGMKTLHIGISESIADFTALNIGEAIQILRRKNFI